MHAKEYFEYVRDTKREYDNAMLTRLYGRPHQTTFGKSSDISDPTAAQFMELAEADAIIEYFAPIIAECELVIKGLRVVMTDTSKIPDVLHMRYLELLPPSEIMERLRITRRRESYLCELGFKLADSMGKALLIEKSKN